MRITIETRKRCFSFSVDRVTDEPAKDEFDPRSTTAAVVDRAPYNYMTDDRAAACFGFAPTKGKGSR